MAHDLIPSSPAGRPEPDGDQREPSASGGREPSASDGAGQRDGSLWAGGTASAGGRAGGRAGAGSLETATAAFKAEEALEESGGRLAESGERPYRTRFGFLLGAMIGIGIAAVAIAATLMAGSGRSSISSDWSAWAPRGDGAAAAQQIATHVGRQYRLGNGDQLVAVTGGPLKVSEVPLSVALRNSSAGSDIEVIEGDKGTLYTLNGLGPRGSIAEGKPSAERHVVLRREALELALYTFQYVADSNLVVVLMPPKPPEKGVAATQATQETQALFFRPGDLTPQLEAPLRQTLAASTPRPETIRPPELTTVDRLTRPNLFRASFTQGQDAQAFLVLDRLPG